MFIVATANDVSQLPPELLRKGRFDECFFVDLPNDAEREVIWGIQVKKHGRSAEKYDLVALARASGGLTGSEIEQAFIDALYAGFAQKKEPDELTVSLVLNDLVPLSRLVGEQITGLRDWAKGRARLATASVEQKQGRRIAA